MTDKVQKIREAVEKRYEYWKEKEFNSHSIESEIRMSECNYLLLMLNSMQEEPATEDLGEYINELSKQFPEVSFAKLSRIAVRVAKWQKEQLMAKAINTQASLTMSVPSICISLPLGVNVGDKVKVIVIKEG